VRSFLITLEYDGTDYAGFQRQANAPTIQAEVEGAIARLTGQPATVRGAGRTDTGVHAAALPAVFRSGWPGTTDRLTRGLNHFLPPAIAVRGTREVPASFDPRRCAIGRRYRYTVLSREARSPLHERFAYRVPGRLDLPAMTAALDTLVGDHDVASFTASAQVGGTVRRMTEARLEQIGDLLHVHFAANAFLMHQIRNTVGTLLWVGQGRLSPADFAAILAARDRRLAGPAAPPHGLCLLEVLYEGKHEDA
jgi:tRNA pseudouridine38-40 synthase